MVSFSKKPTAENKRTRIETLVKPAKEHSHSGERQHAIGMLGKMGEPAVQALSSFLNSSDPVIRWNAASALGQTGSEKAVDPLVQALRDENGTVRSHAALALGEIGSREAVGPLVEAFWDNQRGLASPAATALGQIGDKSVTTELESSIDDMENFPYFQVGQALKKFGSDKAEECFIIGMTSDKYYTRAA